MEWSAREARKRKSSKNWKSELRLYPVNEQVWASAKMLARRCREKGITASTAAIIDCRLRGQLTSCRWSIATVTLIRSCLSRQNYEN